MAKTKLIRKKDAYSKCMVLRCRPGGARLLTNCGRGELAPFHASPTTFTGVRYDSLLSTCRKASESAPQVQAGQFVTGCTSEVCVG